jgi:uncharacterized protein
MDYDKPSKGEDEYFARQEVERRKQWAKEKAQGMAASEKEKLKQQHFMKCPKCGMDMSTIELHGVKVDQCASCGGVFFDAGEVEQLLNHEHGSGVFSKIFSVFR